MDANYLVLLVNLIIWIGLFIYLFRLDHKVSELKTKD
ncbi:MAG: CcmD family protein [candidate division Zixibacteria bacterium]|nr:CcmD family protein [candidate division Zixibacteria bacterium]